MNELKIFENQEFGKIRSLMVNNEPYFVAKDICDILEIKNTTMAINRLDEDEVTKFNLGGLSGETNIVNEYGLYNLILASRKPEAKAFKKWITHEVIPSIRKNGMYATNELLDNPDLAIKVFEQLKQEREEKKKLQLENAQQKQMIGELKPKADYVDTILQNKGLVTITAIAKDYGMSGEKMNEKLHNLGVQYKQSNQWLLYSKYHDNGYTHSETISLKHKDGTPFVKMLTKWTQKGRLFLYELLKNNGLVPVVER